jgi:putative ABC transport system permease protein
MIPLRYNIRNLRVRRVSTAMTVLGTGLIVWSSCILFGLVDGLQHSLEVSGDPLDLIVIRKGSTNENTGGFDWSKAEDLKTVPGTARGEGGRPLVASEMVHIPLAERLDGGTTNIIVRGVEPPSRQLRPAFTIIQGRDLVPGRGECIVSRSMSRRFKGAALGGLLKVSEKERFRVVGVFTAGGSAAESEVWVDIHDLARAINRVGTVSCVQMRAASPADLERVKSSIDNDTQFRLAAVRESDYFANQSLQSLFLKGTGTVIAVFLSIGAMFAAANTMYAAVSARTREIGTMRALGFPRRDILLLPGRVGAALRPGGAPRPRRHGPPEGAHLRHPEFQQLRRGDRRVPDRPPGDDGRDRDDAGDGGIRRAVPRPARGAARRDPGPPRAVTRTRPPQRADSRSMIRRASGSVSRLTSKALVPGRSTGTPGSTSRNRSTGWMFRLIRGVL